MKPLTNIDTPNIRHILRTVLLLSVGFGLSACSNFENDPYVYFQARNLTDFSFQMEAHSITSGQSWSGIETGTKTNPKGDNAGYIKVNSGRKGSRSVAIWYEKALDAGGQAIGHQSRSRQDTPDELNYAFSGTMRFTLDNQRYTCENVVIGQEYNPTDWWFGGKSWTRTMSIGNSASELGLYGRCKVGTELGYVSVARVFPKSFYGTKTNTYQLEMATVRGGDKAKTGKESDTKGE